jgi:hypothetical protein
MSTYELPDDGTPRLPKHVGMNECAECVVSLVHALLVRPDEFE